METINRYSQNIPKNVPRDKAIATSALGTPVYCDITIYGGSYEGATAGQTISFPQINLQSVLISVTQNKVIIKTEIAGRNGTVKEYIGLSDYLVTINGIITGENGVRPRQAIADFVKMLVAPIPIKVASQYLQDMGIDSLCIETYDLPQDEGGYNYQTFQLNCISDLPEEIRIADA